MTTTEARALFEAGKLDEAIEALTLAVKTNPSDTSHRTFLFELLCFAGQWDRAEKQLDVIGHQSAQADLGVQVYRNNIKAERERQRLFADGTAPHFLNEPPAYVDYLVEAVNKLQAGDAALARESLDHAEVERPAFSGKLNGAPFEDFRDYDDTIGPILELIVKDKYTWLPFEQVRRFEVAPPKSLRDLIWAQVRIVALDGTIGEVYMPALYSGSSKSENVQVRLGRMTDWVDMGGDVYRAVGLRLFLVDDVDQPVFAATTVEFDVPTKEVQDLTQSVPS
jgi:type VI secretion system protein ImpE